MKRLLLLGNCLFITVVLYGQNSFPPTGNAGIGTTSGFNSISSTESTLHIANPNVASLYLNCTSYDKYALYSAYQGGFTIYNITQGKAPFNIIRNGNIGIGTPTPNAKLEVVGTNSTGHESELIIHSLGTTYNNPKLSLYSDYGNDRNWQLTTAVTALGDFHIRVSNASGGDPYSAGNSKLVITKEGFVGIGTTSPKALLDVSNYQANTLGSILARLPEGDSQGEGTYLGVRSINTTPAYSNSFSIEHKFYGMVNSSINFYRGGSMQGGFLTFSTNNNTEQMRITVSGNVGIGTTNPTAKLAVNGDIKAREVKVTIEPSGLA